MSERNHEPRIQRGLNKPIKLNLTSLRSVWAAYGQHYKFFSEFEIIKKLT
jgi:hypothetical protein